MVEIVSPRCYTRAVANDLRARGGRLDDVEICGSADMIRAFAPLKTMLGYADALRELSQAQAQLSMQYQGHKEVLPGEPPDDLFPQAMALRA